MQLARSFELLEARLMQELADIRHMLLRTTADRAADPTHPADVQYHLRSAAPPSVGNYMQLVPQSGAAAAGNGTPPSVVRAAEEAVTTALPAGASSPTSTTPATPSVPATASTSSTPTLSATNATTSTERTIHFRPVQTKSLLSPKKSASKLRSRTRPRELEVAKFNNTQLRGDDIRIFSYYWRLEHFARQLSAGVQSIDSPVFAIAGLRLRVHATLNHLNRDYLHLQLQSVPAASTADATGDHDDDDENDEDTSNVILESGTMFRDIKTREYFRHKIAILDQETPTEDLVSQELVNTLSGFQVPNSAIRSGPYAKDSTILIKVVIYL